MVKEAESSMKLNILDKLQKFILTYPEAKWDGSNILIHDGIWESPV